MSQLTQIQQPQQIQVAEPYSVDDILRQVKLIQTVMHSVMKEGEHFGKIPGCGDKPTLLKAGAEKLQLTFRMAPEFIVLETPYPNGHREYRVSCTMRHITTGQILGQGVGCCSTMEGKWRFRQEVVPGAEVPKNYWETRDAALLGGPNRRPQKRDGKWVVLERVEHDNPADAYNTVLKMAKKRAQVDAVLTCTAASDIFTQDIEETEEDVPARQEKVVTETKPQRQEAHTEKSTSSNQSPAGEQELVQISGVTSKRGKKANGQPWTRYGVKVKRGDNTETWANTFDTNLGKVAESLKGQPAVVVLEKSEDGQSLNLVSIAPFDDAPQTQPADDVPMTY